MQISPFFALPLFRFDTWGIWVMRESIERQTKSSSLRRGTIVLKKFREEQSCKFGTVVRALWPLKPALNLAQRAGISERGAQYLIDGKRKPSARAVHAVNSAFFE